MHRVLMTALLLGLVMLEGSPLLAQTPEAFESAWQDLEKYYQDGLREAGSVGSSMMFVQDGEVLGTSYYGLADQTTGRPVDEHTIYHWASNTKMFTAIAIMQLRDRGLLKLDDPIVQYVPELRAVYNPFGDMEGITLRHLMSHAAGFRASTWPWKDRSKGWHPHEPTRWDQLVAMFPYTEILFEPGSKFSYSNPGIIFLGRVVEQLSGEDYEVYIDKNIFKPLEMYQSYFDHTPYHLLDHRSNSYFIENGEMTTNGLDFDTGITVSNGGLNAPLGDMAKYLNFLVGSEENQAVYDGVLKRASLEELWEVQQVIDADAALQRSMGLSFFIMQQGDLRLVGHTGDQMGFTSFVYADPKSRTGCIVAFNTIIRNQDEEGQSHSPSSQLFSGLRTKFLADIFPLFISSK